MFQIAKNANLGFSTQTIQLNCCIVFCVCVSVVVLIVQMFCGTSAKPTSSCRASPRHNIPFIHSFHHHFHFMFVFNLCLNKCLGFFRFCFWNWKRPVCMSWVLILFRYVSLTPHRSGGGGKFGCSGTAAAAFYSVFISCDLHATFALRNNEVDGVSFNNIATNGRVKIHRLAIFFIHLLLPHLLFSFFIRAMLLLLLWLYFVFVVVVVVSFNFVFTLSPHLHCFLFVQFTVSLK